MPSHSFAQWAWAARTWSLPVSATPVLITLFYLWWSGHPVDWPLGLTAMIAFVLLHLAGNAWSDWHDFRRGVDRADTPGARSIVEGVFTPREIMALAITLAAAGCAMGIALVVLTGWPLLWIGLAGMVLTAAYPPLKYRALGEVVILLNFCVLPAIGTAWVASGALVWESILAVVPSGLVTVAVLFANNFRDVRSDSQAGITTVPMRIAPRAAGIIYAALVFTPYLWLAVCAAASALPWLSLIALLTAPITWSCARYVWQGTMSPPADFSQADERTAKLQLALSALIIAGLAIAAIMA